jgi:hypothetical protein
MAAFSFSCCESGLGVEDINVTAETKHALDAIVKMEREDLQQNQGITCSLRMGERDVD